MTGLRIAFFRRLNVVGTDRYTLSHQFISYNLTLSFL
jgi:hypothetical protein